MIEYAANDDLVMDTSGNGEESSYAPDKCLAYVLGLAPASFFSGRHNLVYSFKKR
jgi:hypothetical protein